MGSPRVSFTGPPLGSRPRRGAAWTAGALLSLLTLATTPRLQAVEPDAPDPLVPYAVELHRTTWDFAADGTGESTLEVRVRLESPAGVQAFGQMQFPYLAGRTELDLTALTVSHPDGTIEEVPSDAARHLPAPVTAAFPVYSDIHVLHVTPPNLGVGDVIAFTLHTRIVAPDAPGRIEVQYSFDRATLIASEVFEVTLPAAAPVRLRHAPDLPPEITTIGERTTYRWTHEVLELPGAPEPEPYDPHALTPIPDIELSTFPDWASVGDWYAELALERARPTAELRRRAAELTAGIEDDRARIRALYDFVRRHVRYLGLQFGAARYQPHPAAEILRNAYGDCKDKHTLLAALLQAEGFKVHPVLVGVSRKPTPEVPGPGQFDHLITAVELDGEILWLDSTQASNPLGYLSPAIRGKQALLVRSGDPSQLVELPADLPYPSRSAIELTGSVDEIGSLEGHVALTLRDDTEPMVRATLLAATAEQRREFLEATLDASHLDVELESVETGDLLDTEEPLRLAAVVRRANFLDAALTEVSLLAPGFHFQTMDEDDPPRYLGAPTTYTATIDLDFPAGAQLEPPLPVEAEQPFASLHSTYEVTGPRLRVRRSVDVRQPRVELEQRAAYNALRRAQRNDHDQDLRVRFAALAGIPTSGEGDAEASYAAGVAALERDDPAAAIQALRDATELAPEHPQAWYHLGRGLVLNGDPEAGIVALKRQLELDPYHEKALRDLGWTHEKAGQVDAALEAYRAHLNLDPGSTYSLRRLGLLLAGRGEFEASLPYLRRARRESPENQAILWRLLHAELHAGDLALAHETLADALTGGVVPNLDDELLDVLKHGHLKDLPELGASFTERTPESARDWFDRGLYDRYSGDDEAALSAFGHALGIDPELHAARLERAAALFRLQRCAEAVHEYRAYLEAQPDDDDTRYWFGRCLICAGDEDAAGREFAVVLENRPQHPGARLGMAFLSLRAGDEAGARKLADEIAAEPLADPELRLQLARLDVWNGRKEWARGALLELRQLHVPGTDGCGMLAWALDEAGASAEADDLAHACLAAGEEISQVSYLLGLMTSRGGNYAAAWAHFERALDTASPDHRAWLERDEALLYVREQVLPEEASGDGTR